MSKPITEEWLKSVGFKWHRLERQPSKHWLLWLGSGLVNPAGDRERIACREDLGIELAYNGLTDQNWFCWLRSDSAHRYHRFIHVRHLHTEAEVIALVEALTGLSWNPENHFYGEVMTPQDAARCRERDRRFDIEIATGNPSWYATEKDDSRGGPLLEHLHAHAKETEAE